MGGRMVSILPNTRCLHPWSCSVDTAVPFTHFNIQQGMKAYLGRSEVFIPEADFFVDLTGAEQCELSLWPIGVAQPAEATEIAAKLSVLRGLLSECNGEYDLSPLVTEKNDNLYSGIVRPRLEALHSAFVALDRTAAAEAAASIAGCGVGLTPSSDDLLLGYICAFIALSLALERSREEVLALTSALSAAAAERTNVISGAFLRQSGEGLASADILSLLDSFFSGAPPQKLEQAGKRVLTYGSTSGADILTGIVLSLNSHLRGENIG